MVKVREHLPNAITLANLSCGSLACLEAVNHHVFTAACLIIGGAVLDLADGLVARLLHVSSAMGKELDSLADIITFGLAPSLIAYNYLSLETHGLTPRYEYAFILIPVCAAIRLARFNLAPEQNTYFVGLPTPACALIICALPVFQRTDLNHNSVIHLSLVILLLIVIGLSLLMISKVPMLSIKFNTRSWPLNRSRYIFLVSAVLTSLLGIISIPLIILYYFVVSLTQDFLDEKV